MPLICYLKMYFFNCNSSLDHVAIVFFKIPFVLCAINNLFKKKKIIKENDGDKYHCQAIGVVFLPVYILYCVCSLKNNNDVLYNMKTFSPCLL